MMIFFVGFTFRNCIVFQANTNNQANKLIHEQITIIKNLA